MSADASISSNTSMREKLEIYVEIVDYLGASMRATAEARETQPWQKDLSEAVYTSFAPMSAIRIQNRQQYMWFIGVMNDVHPMGIHSAQIRSNSNLYHYLYRIVLEVFDEIESNIDTFKKNGYPHHIDIEPLESRIRNVKAEMQRMGSRARM